MENRAISSEQWGKFRLPLGSLIVDVTLVFAMAWWGATMQTRFEQAEAHDHEVQQALATQISSLSDAVNRTNNGARIESLEARLTAAEASRLEMKADITDRLDRIESKLDRALR